MNRLVNVERNGSTAIFTMMNPPVNALTRELVAALQEAWSGCDADRVVITGSGKMFVAGADIREIERITRREAPPDMSYLNELLNRIERSGKLVIMAMNGGALGIGLELAMAGHFRILKAGAMVGLPEVKLGLIPGAGGTQRLPRLVGAEAALRLCMTGEAIPAEAALECGLVDEVCAGDVVERALAVTTGNRTDQRACSSYADWDRWAAMGSPRQRSPQRAVAAIRAASEAVDFEHGLAEEARLFREALLDEQARAMVHLFFAERELGKVPFLDKAVVAAPIEGVKQVGDEIELEAGGTCRLRCSPEEFGGRVMEVRNTPDTRPEVLAAALQYVRKQGKLAVVCMGEGEWLGRREMDSSVGLRLVAEGRALRASDLDVLMVRGYGYPEESGGPMHTYSMTPSQTSESLRDPLK
jgi:enoyl-CoA hydratase/carnithine racemase